LIALASTFDARTFASTTNVAVSGFTFVPPSVTIRTGDSVNWTGLEPGFHNVQTDSDPYCGAPSGSLTTCIHTFNEAGTYQYYCITHRAFNMIGTVIVQAAANTPPSVTITNPPSGAVFAAPANITVQANATDQDGSVTNVQFFANTAAVGSASANPFSIVASSLAAGDYALTAVATDNGGLASTSAPVNISVVAPVDVTLSPPSVSNGQFQFNYSANSGLRYVIENSSNFVNWAASATNTASSASELFREAFDVNSLRFYRVGRLPNP
jgi:plastocyanin